MIYYFGQSIFHSNGLLTPCTPSGNLSIDQCLMFAIGQLIKLIDITEHKQGLLSQSFLDD